MFQTHYQIISELICYSFYTYLFCDLHLSSNTVALYKCAFQGPLCTGFGMALSCAAVFRLQRYFFLQYPVIPPLDLE